jgi:hypothetical protein
MGRLQALLRVDSGDSVRTQSTLALCKLHPPFKVVEASEFPQHQAPCLRPAVIPLITFRVKLESRRR